MFSTDAKPKEKFFWHWGFKIICNDLIILINEMLSEVRAMYTQKPILRVILLTKSTPSPYSSCSVHFLYSSGTPPCLITALCNVSFPYLYQFYIILYKLSLGIWNKDTVPNAYLIQILKQQILLDYSRILDMPNQSLSEICLEKLNMYYWTHFNQTLFFPD